MTAVAHAPVCPTCRLIARLTDGSQVYSNRPDLAEKPVWLCDGCGGFVGCHPGTTKPLGTPAGPELRRARALLHDRMIDPLWKLADVCGEYEPEDQAAALKIRQAARSRVYSYLADRLGKSGKETHTGLFDLATCRRAWRVLQGRTYADIRAWAKAHAASKRKVKTDA
ncbi:MAG: hypothetical protein DI527_00455 [Chelatococcus sp.]|nr:MAG: hypothetical protein DI527_00455 [Chelatococcus sp.]